MKRKEPAMTKSNVPVYNGTLRNHSIRLPHCIRECSGIVCLCLPEDKVRQLDLPQMVANNTCKNRTAFTISIEAAEGVTTGVSAADRVKTIRTAIADGAVPGDLNHPGHVFPLCARSGGVRLFCQIPCFISSTDCKMASAM